MPLRHLRRAALAAAVGFAALGSLSLPAAAYGGSCLPNWVTLEIRRTA